MRNLFLIVVHFTTIICISQNTNPDSDKKFTIHEIDSISDKNGRYIISEGKIEAILETKAKKQKTKILNGSGGFSYNLYQYHFNEEKYNALSQIEQRKYNFDKYTNLIKGKYHQAIHYENAYSENIYGEFYYFKTLLFYVKIRIIKSENNKEDISETFSLSLAELDDPKEIKSFFIIVKSWVNEKNNEILKIYNRK
ncbi:hypothetical protein SAMN05444671_0956 [Flavobacterium sp. CF108]|uniref:hypothetical protein n=1 Tax=unclassified Flavobacterium TaxID=196869 RepID=UPI0008B4A232|nr:MULTISPECIES: hypothetical protein [unclassified Flavobacterium]SEO11692.1 hypothetical protein SAMN04487978_2122 [Flavobacterium sp. fv08]SHG60928.1 hypothetical protein SAMN05444671_0956 [Flavobacterium sp. CF108]